MKLIDLTAYRCPYPLVQIKLLLKQLPQGETLKVLLSDPGSCKDVPTWAKKSGYQVSLLQQDKSIMAINITK
ncbi:sulfurtransferase TusA family protein [Shewanella sp. HL-SH8]|jgi:tRNA 2-thiouridine synthesizing protein A|uniref:sulfurtransferase TusA family protein n=1 Tax=Shewanella TaxID=22 RepID=UPI001CF8E597|nr:sulfurtransferase TusA family protein [Shewanella glacialimarina]UCX04658.1 sulfurtransferase TusA family protein [Shewanella glacialimarina]